VAPVPAEADPLACFEEGNFGANCVDDSSNLMARSSRVRNARPEAFFGEHIAVADATSLDAYAHVSRTGIGEFFLN
jgi:hypothetical protein